MQDSAINFRCSEDFKKNFDNICEKTNKSQRELVEFAVEMIEELIEYKESIERMGELKAQGKILLANQLLKNI